MTTLLQDCNHVFGDKLVGISVGSFVLGLRGSISSELGPRKEWATIDTSTRDCHTTARPLPPEAPPACRLPHMVVLGEGTLRLLQPAVFHQEVSFLARKREQTYPLQ